MKKVFKFMLVLIMILGAGLLIAGMIMPKDIIVTRIILIKAPKDAVFEQMVKFKNWPNWSPWYALDTAAKITYSGTDGTTGCGYSWESKIKDVGAGTMTNSAVTPTQIDFHIDIREPYVTSSDATLKVSDSAKMTKATWILSTHCTFPMNALQLFPFMNIEKMIGNSFETGLAKMKRYVESNAVPVSDVAIKEVDYPAHIFLGMRQVVNWVDIMKYFDDFKNNVEKEIADKANGPVTGLYYTWDTAHKNTDMVAAFPVSDSTKKLMGTTFINLEPSKALLSVYKGGYSGMMKVHMALAKELAKKGKPSSLVIEEYLAGPKQEPDSNKWVTNVYYLYKQ